MITKWLSSYRTYSLSVLYTHILIFAFFFPHVILYTGALMFMCGMLLLWCDLQYSIETANRLALVGMIEKADNEVTKDMLKYELYLHDKNALLNQTDVFGYQISI